MKKYYFIIFKCKRFGWNPQGISTGMIETECQDIINKHPIQFQLDSNEKYGKEHETGGGHKGREEYLVTNWIEISKEEYNKYKGRVG